MAQTDIRSLQQIKRETEQTRASLTDTVDQLKTTVSETASDIRHRISPDAIKAEVSDYIKSRGEQLWTDLTVAARNNPMQAVAVGASVAYPLLRLARAIPLPVLMVGAGLFFAGSKTGQAASQKASDLAADVSDEVVRRAGELGNQAQEQASAATAYASDQFDRINAAVRGGADQVREAADAAGEALAAGSKTIRDSATAVGTTIADRASSFKEESLRMTGSAAGAAQDAVTDATATVRSAAQTVSEGGTDALGTIKSTASDSPGRESYLSDHRTKSPVSGWGRASGRRSDRERVTALRFRGRFDRRCQPSGQASRQSRCISRDRRREDRRGRNLR